MNFNQSEPVSAFAIYSQNSKQKRKPDNSNVHLVSKKNKCENVELEAVAFKKTKQKKLNQSHDKTIFKQFVPLVSNGINTCKTMPNCSNSATKTNILTNKLKMKSKKMGSIILENNKTALRDSAKQKSTDSLSSVTTEESNEDCIVNSPVKKKIKNIIEKGNEVMIASPQHMLNSPNSKNSTSLEGTIASSIDNLSSSEEDINTESDESDTKSCNLNKEISTLLTDINRSSIDIATSLFEWLIKPLSVQRFMREYWEKTPLFVQRNVQNYFSALLSTPEIDSILRNNNVLFGKHVDITSYSNGQRETHNESGRAQPHVVWDFYSNACSVRFLNPQIFVKKILALNTTLQEYFGCFVGSNVYLTPPDSQGFAPHYDDIEAFVLQVEGKKRWKVYKPRNKHEYLDRYSSPNFSEEDIGEPMLDIVVQAGDLLYFPRGFIHQACTVPGEHSLHITLSVYQHTAWVDLLEKVLPAALKRAAYEDCSYRKGLPIGYLQSLGLGINPASKSKQRGDFIRKTKELVTKLADHLDDLANCVDQMGVQFMHDALPVVISPDELNRTVFGDGLHMNANGVLSKYKDLTETTKVKLLRANVCRLIEEEQETRLYYTVDNSLEYRAEEARYLPLSPESTLLVQHLILRYPEFVAINDIPCPNDNEDKRYQTVRDLWERGLLLTDRPLEEVRTEEEENLNENDES